MKLIQDGNNQSLEKDKAWATRLDNLKKELATLSQGVEGRLDTKLLNLERNQQNMKSTLEQRIDQSERKFVEGMNLLEKKITSHYDDKLFDLRKQTQEQLKTSVEGLKNDYESLIKALGNQIRDAVTKLKDEFTILNKQTKRECDEKLIGINSQL